MRHSLLAVAAMASASLGLVACGGGSSSSEADAAIMVSTGTYYHFVTDSVTVGATTTEADSFAFDLDGDKKPDNTLGDILAILKTQGLDVQTSITSALTAGQFVILYSIRADDLAKDSTVSWRVLLGPNTPNPVL